ncbi:DUF982 domain-containing protein [Aquamicrobium soli]|uniref:DUF982 domain-containing protein n=1 Tax=Aquamicrobium soli TaxID=1811518 RepID=A0ABV7K6S1_9HYPH
MTVRGWWGQPVFIWIGIWDCVACTAEAEIVLRSKWPAPKGPLYQAACEACEYAMRETGNHRQARLAFIRAAKESHLVCIRQRPQIASLVNTPQD